MMSLWDALRMNMMISYQELVRTFLNSSRRARSGSRLLPGISIYGKQISQARDIYY